MCSLLCYDLHRWDTGLGGSPITGNDWMYCSHMLVSIVYLHFYSTHTLSYMPREFGSRHYKQYQNLNMDLPLLLLLLQIATDPPRRMKFVSSVLPFLI